MSNQEPNKENEYDLTGIPPLKEDFTLEEILAEYGGSLEQTLMRQAEAEIRAEAPEEGERPDTAGASSPAQEPDRTAPPPEEAAPQSPAVGEPPVPEPGEVPPAAPVLPEPPRPISLEEVVGSTVDAVMSGSPEAPPEPRRSLFSRSPLEETAPEPPPRREPRPAIEPIGPEEDLWDAAESFRSGWRRRKASVVPALLVALLAAAPLLAEYYGYSLPMWTGDQRFQSILYLAVLSIQMLLCRHVFVRGFSMLARRRCVGEFLISLAGLTAAGDCAACLVLPERTPVTPYAAAACMALFFAQWAVSRGSRGMYDTFRAAAMDDPPPYLITDTERGACKQRGTVPGFYTTALRPDGSALLQTILLPLVLVGTFVFAGMTSLGQERGSDFLLNWSILLAAGGTCALPLCWALPWSRLSRHLQQVGCAVAGWSGAERISRRRAMILTDSDLFPPGTMRLNGVKIYGEERMKILTYAEAMARRAGSGLGRLFDRLLRGEGGIPQEDPVEFSFYEEGGWSAVLHAETVTMGTASFMRKMEVRLPDDITMKTGIFMAIDRRLAAVFAIKYNPADNVDFALRLLRWGRITPILASRDPNIDPMLLKRKFHKGLRLEYPGLSDRVALSEAGQNRDLPRALLFREGLLPYAETVAGSRRLCQAVRKSTLISLAGSAAGVLLGFYLLARQAYDLLNPLSLLVFLLLWTLPALLIADWAGRY